MSNLKRHFLTLFAPIWLLFVSASQLPLVVFGMPSVESLDLVQGRITVVSAKSHYDGCEQARFGYDDEPGQPTSPISRCLCPLPTKQVTKRRDSSLP